MLSIKRILVLFFCTLSAPFIVDSAVTVEKLEEVKSIFPVRVYEENSVMFSTVRINTDAGCGTGFFWKDYAGNSYLVTNKHVAYKAYFENPNILDNTLGNGDNFRIRLHLADGEAIVGSALVKVTDPVWVRHPKVDLCVFCMNDMNVVISNVLQQKANLNVSFHDALSPPPSYLVGKPFFLSLNTLVTNRLPETTLDQTLCFGDKVSMIGYPKGLIDEKNNLPLGRTGTIASDPRTGFEGREEFVVDMACMGGSSGSPVLSVPQPGCLPKLLGILRAGPVPPVAAPINPHILPSLAGVGCTYNTLLQDLCVLRIFDIPINYGYVIMKYRLDEIMPQPPQPQAIQPAPQPPAIHP